MKKTAKQKPTSGAQRVGYARVSTITQNTERQLEGVQLDKLFTDHASGKDIDRPQLQAAILHVREGDTLVVHSMDRLARNFDDLRKIVNDLTGRGVTVEFMTPQHLTFTGEDTSLSKLLLNLLGSFAEFERSLILERQREGIALARQRGVYKGRKPALTPERINELKKRVKARGVIKAHLAKEFGISRETLYQYTRAPKRRRTAASAKEAA